MPLLCICNLLKEILFKSLLIYHNIVGLQLFAIARAVHDYTRISSFTFTSVLFTPQLFLKRLQADFK